MYDKHDDWFDKNGEPLEPIKPCPFCGAKAILQDDHYEEPVIDENGAYVDMDFLGYGFTWVICSECGIRTDDYDNEPEKAIADWNKRVNDWIDVKERMPEKTGDYLCIMPDGEQDVVYFDAEIDKIGYEFPFGFADLDYPDEFHSVPVWIEVRVLFWQPLPLSYVKQKDGSYVDTQALIDNHDDIDWGLEEGENHE